MFGSISWNGRCWKESIRVTHAKTWINRLQRQRQRMKNLVVLQGKENEKKTTQTISMCHFALVDSKQLMLFSILKEFFRAYLPLQKTTSVSLVLMIEVSNLLSQYSLNQLEWWHLTRSMWVELEDKNWVRLYASVAIRRLKTDKVRGQPFVVLP